MHSLGQHFESAILSATQATELHIDNVIQELWSGYGKILRVRLEGGEVETVVVKHVRMPAADRSHPRGWNSSASHARKLKSYEVESAWYRDWGHRCDATCRIPRSLAFETSGDEVLMVLEDLDASGYPARLGRVEWRHIEICLHWLANFHATWMGVKPDGLWNVGTYWHLDTRAEELEVLDDTGLKAAAHAIDAKLTDARFQTFVHGDAKLANFCFSRGGDQVAAVDFQYVGGGCGMKDVAYFVGSCLDESGSERMESQVLDCYFTALRHGLERHSISVDPDAVIAEWRDLYPVAWTDFHRFLKGWSPGHWKINSYSERLAQEAVARLAR
ncbi:MAG: phosphotransferase [Verrucomicrobiales bacterium]